MALKTYTFAPGDTWRKLGYLAYTNSTDYRQVLETNPDWDVLTLPPVGAVIKIEVEDSKPGQTLVSGFFWEEVDNNIEATIFPFDSITQYESQVSKYTYYSLLNNNELNGYTMDTNEAVTGVQ